MSQYLPSFFNKTLHNEEINKQDSQDKIEIPLSPLEPLQPKLIKDTLTIFGFSKENLPNIVNEINKYKPHSIDYNSNYINIQLDTKDFKNILKLNRTKINGEIIGVYRNNLIGDLDSDIFDNESMKKEGFFKKLFKLFF